MITLFCSLVKRRRDLLHWDLLWHVDLRQGGARQEDDSWGTTWTDWWNHGPSYWILNPQWSWDNLLCHQVLCIPSDRKSWCGNWNKGEVQKSLDMNYFLGRCPAGGHSYQYLFPFLFLDVQQLCEKDHLEIMHYALKFFVSLRMTRADVVTATSDKFKNQLT